MFRIHVRQLKNLRRSPVPPEVIAAGRLRLIAVIEAAPMIHRPSAWFMSAAWRPAMAAMLVVVVATGGGTVAAAHDALPGETLYAVKLAGEGFRERIAITQEQRFVVQAAHASRRLEETERLLEIQGLGGEDRAARVRDAMDRYEGHVFAMSEIAVKLEADPEKPRKGKKALMAAEGMLDRHVHMIESATHVEPLVASIMIDQIDATFSLEDDMFSAIPTDDGDEEDVRMRQRREREVKIGDSLKRMRLDFKNRREEESRDGQSPGESDRRSEDSDGGDADDDGGDRGAEARVETGSSFDFSLEKPLEIRLGM